MLLRFTLADRTAKPLEEGELSDLLDGPNILRLAIVDARDGMPLVHPVWYYYKDGKFLVCTDRDGIKARSVRKNPNVYFLVDVDPDEGAPRGVRGKGTAKVVDDPDYATKITTHNVLRYLGSLDGTVADKLIEMGKDSSVIEITPRYMATWKY
jgi:nitroimidazol reductase NimA-like FMN-containing flavoprotein (pyridoxamine 5'-phosphate oxidase superfamily)